MTEPSEARLEQRAEQLKERVYISFTALAVTIALRSESTDATAAAAAGTLLVAVVGTLLAVFLADVVAHIAVHASLPDRAELGHMARVSFGSIGVVVLPLAFIGLAALGAIALSSALTASAFVLVGTLIVVGWLAVRRLRLPVGQRLLVLLAEAALGALVLLLETTH